MKSPEQRGPFGAWLREQRTARGFRTAAIAAGALLQQRRYGIAPSTWAELESGTRRPSEGQREHLVAFFGSSPVDAEPAADLVALLARQVAAMEAQTAAINELVAWLSGLRPEAALERGVRRALEEAALQDAEGSPPERPPRPSGGTPPRSPR